MDLLIGLVGLAGDPRDPPVSASPGMGLQAGSSFLTWVLASEPGSCVCTANTLLTFLSDVLSPGPLFQPLHVEGDGLAVSRSALMAQETETPEMMGPGDPRPGSHVRPMALRLSYSSSGLGLTRDVVCQHPALRGAARSRDRWEALLPPLTPAFFLQMASCPS